MGLESVFSNFDPEKLLKEVKSGGKDSLGGATRKGGSVRRAATSLDTRVKDIKNNILNGNFKPISGVTKEIRRIRGNHGTKPLIDTGNLLNSIRKKGDGSIEMAWYGEYHLEDRVTVENSFTKWFKKTRGAEIAGRTVPKRDFLGGISTDAPARATRQRGINPNKVIEDKVFEIFNGLFDKAFK
jgi:hypothetical protein